LAPLKRACVQASSGPHGGGTQFSPRSTGLTGRPDRAVSTPCSSARL
jgi:hypothetical protein